MTVLIFDIRVLAQSETLPVKPAHALLYKGLKKGTEIVLKVKEIRHKHTHMHAHRQHNVIYPQAAFSCVQDRGGE